MRYNHKKQSKQFLSWRDVFKIGIILGIILVIIALAFLSVIEWDLRGEIASHNFEMSFLDFNPDKQTNEIPLVGSCEVVNNQCNLFLTYDPQIVGKNE